METGGGAWWYQKAWDMIIEGKIKGSAGSKSIDFGVILGISLPVWVGIAMGVGLWGRLG